MPKIWEIQDAKNAADLLDDDLLDEIGRDCIEGFEADKSSRLEWDERTDDAIKLALQIVEEKTFPWQGAANVKFPLITIAALQFAARAYPALVKAPLIVKYRVNGEDPSGAKASRAARIGRHMSYQLLEEDEAWEEEFDRALITLPIIGTIFKKSYFDPVKKRNCSRLTMPQNLYVNYYTKKLEECPRKSEVFFMYRRQIRERQLRGVFLDVELEGESQIDSTLSDKRQGISPPPDDKTKPRRLIEQHCYLDLDKDGYEEPYVVTIDVDTHKVLRIYHRFAKVVTEQTLKIDALNDQQKALMIQMQQIAEKAQQAQQQVQQEVQQAMQAQQQGQQGGQPDPQLMAAMQQKMQEIAYQAEQQMAPLQMQIQEASKMIEQLQEDNKKKPKVIEIDAQEHYTKYGFIPSPDGGFYDLGFGALLGPLNDTVNTLINQLLDSGTLQQGNSGFIGKGARIDGGRLEFSPFEWKKVSVAGQALRDNIVPLPVNPPSPVLFQLLGMMIEYAQRVSSVSDIMSGDNPGQNTPAYNYQSMLEQGMQVFNGIFKRVYRSLRSEMRKIYVINSIYMNPIDYYETQDGRFEILQNDYKADPRDVYPAADPNAFSNTEKLIKAQILIARAAQVPGYDTAAIERRWLEANDIEDSQQVFPVNDQGQPLIQPPPNPELELEVAEAQRKALEAKARMQIDTSKAESQIDLDQAQIQLTMAKIKEMGEKIDISWFEAQTRRFEARRKVLENMMEDQRADKDRDAENRRAALDHHRADKDRASQDRNASEDRRDRRVAGSSGD